MEKIKLIVSFSFVKVGSNEQTSAFWLRRIRNFVIHYDLSLVLRPGNRVSLNQNTLVYSMFR